MRTAIRARREGAGLPPLADKPVLQAAARRGAVAMARAIERNPSQPQKPRELSLDPVKRALTGVAKISLEVMAAGSARQLAEKVANCSAAGQRDLTHLGVGVCEGVLAGGQRFQAAVVIAARVLPAISAERIQRGQREFHVSCHQCKEEYLTRVQEPSGKLTGGLGLVCPKCRCLVDLFGIDTSGRYYRPPRFMRGFQPPQPKKLSSPFAAWLFVLTNCRYVEDSKQYGRNEVWQLAQQTYRLRQGDCEDTSILLADWLAAAGYKARAVLGEEGGTGHCWVVVSGGGHDYVLETTGGRGNYRRVPPRAAVSTGYVPRAQFDRSGIWFRTSEKWTSDYHGKDRWFRGPRPSPRVPTEKPSKKR